jgi:hypothetical protein
MYDLAGTPFKDIAGNSFFENLAGIPFVPQKEGEVCKRGPKPPPSFGKRGLQPILKYRKY